MYQALTEYVPVVKREEGTFMDEDKNNDEKILPDFFFYYLNDREKYNITTGSFCPEIWLHHI